MTRFTVNYLIGFALALLFPAAAFAADATTPATADTKRYVITLKNHEFTPMELTVPASQKFELTVKNDDQQPFEFESSQLKREKIVQPNESIIIKFNELKPGTYKYVDDFNESAFGYITVK